MSNEGILPMKEHWRKTEASQVALVVKNMPASTGDMRDRGSIPGSGRSPGRAWQVTDLKVTRSQTQQ